MDEGRWPEFLAAGSFARMKAAADHNAPGADRGTWRSNSDFFRSGRLDAWREILTPGNQALYEAVNAPRLDPEMKAWMELGRSARPAP